MAVPGPAIFAPDYPLLSEERWAGLLAESGYDEVNAVAGEYSVGAGFEQSLLLARRSYAGTTVRSCVAGSWRRYRIFNGTGPRTQFQRQRLPAGQRPRPDIHSGSMAAIPVWRRVRSLIFLFGKTTSNAATRSRTNGELAAARTGSGETSWRRHQNLDRYRRRASRRGDDTQSVRRSTLGLRQVRCDRAPGDLGWHDRHCGWRPDGHGPVCPQRDPRGVRRRSDGAAGRQAICGASGSGRGS